MTPPELTLVANAILQFEAQTDTFAYPTVTATDTTGETITVTHTNNVHPGAPRPFFALLLCSFAPCLLPISSISLQLASSYSCIKPADLGNK